MSNQPTDGTGNSDAKALSLGGTGMDMLARGGRACGLGLGGRRCGARIGQAEAEAIDFDGMMAAAGPGSDRVGLPQSVQSDDNSRQIIIIAITTHASRPPPPSHPHHDRLIQHHSIPTHTDTDRQRSTTPGSRQDHDALVAAALPGLRGKGGDAPGLPRVRRRGRVSAADG